MINDLMELARDPSLLAQQRRRLIGRLGWICALAAVVGHVLYMASSDSLSLSSFVVPLFVVGFLSVPMILRRGAALGLAAIWLLTLLLAATVCLITATGGLDSPLLVLLSVAPIAAVFLAGVRAAWLAGLAAVLSLLVVGLWRGTGAITGDGAWGTSLARGLLVVGAGGLVLALIGLHERQLARLRAKLRDAATSDPLTGLPNRGSLDDVLAVEHHRLARYPDSCLSVILFDLDHFKEYNDSNGHQVADDVLKRIAETALERVRRAPDVLGRYGDDELLAVLPATSGGDAAILADCIRRDIEGLALPHAASPHGVVTVSLGVGAEDAADRGSIDSLLTDADQALRQAKLDGRNCVVIGTRTLEAGD